MSDEENKMEPLKVNVPVSLEPYIPEGLVAQFANYFNVINLGNEWFLSFFQPEVPFIDSQHPVQGPVRARCVSRIVLTPAGLKALAGALNQIVQLSSGAADKPRND